MIPNADFDTDNFQLDQSSFIYFVDDNQEIQEMQQIYADVDRGKPPSARHLG